MTDIFPVNSVGIVTARDALTIHFTADAVSQTITRFASLPEEAAREQFKLGKDARDGTVVGAQKDLNDSRRPPTPKEADALQPILPKSEWQPDPARIVPVAYRPFDTRFTYYSVRADGRLLTCEPAVSLPMAQRYFLF